MLGANRRPRRRPTTVQLRTEMLETRITPAIRYGMGIGSTGIGTINPPPVITDTSPPHITVDNQSGQTVSTNPTITGTIADNNDLPQALIIQVFVDGATTPTATLTAANAHISTSGQFTFTPSVTTSALHTVKFVGIDPAGNHSAPVTFTFTLQTTPLTLSLDAASDPTTPGDNRTVNSTVTLTGTGPHNATITLQPFGGTARTATSDANGNYSFTSVALAAGLNNFTVSATDASNNHETAELNVVRENAPTVAQPIADQTVATGAPDSTFTLSSVFNVNTNSVLHFTTNRGSFDVELFNTVTPNIVANFLSYVNGPAGANFVNSIFHRVTNITPDGISVLQGGGFTLVPASGSTKLTLPAITTHAPVAQEGTLPNVRGTIAMARTDNATSATSQFFFNVADNPSLNPNGTPDNPQNPNSGDGYNVFGVVLGNGMSVIDASHAIPPVNEGGNFSAIPITGATPNDPNFPGDTTPSQYEVLQSVSVTPPTFGVHSDNLSLVTPTITNGVLTLHYTPGQSGVANITVTATDSEGSVVTTMFKVTVGDDGLPPTFQNVTPTGNPTTKIVPTITGTVTDDTSVASLTASVDGGAAQTVTVGAGGSFTFTPTVTGDGPHHVDFVATDGAGNASSPVTVNFTLDTTAPVVMITSNTNGQTFNTNPTITGTAKDNLGLPTTGALTASVDGGAAQAVAVDSQGGFSFQTSLPTDGTADTQHTVVFTATDNAGNTGTASVTFTLNSVQPAVTITTPAADGQAFASNPDIKGSITTGVTGLMASVDGGTPVAVTVDAQGNFTFTPNLATDGTADGSHMVTFSASGNFTAVTRTFVLDTKAPVVGVTSPANGQSFKDNPAIVGTITDTTSGVDPATATATLDTGAPVTLTLDAQGNFTFTPNLATDGSADGPHQVTINATDKAGNAALAIIVTFTLDTTAPALSLTGPAPSGTVLTVSPNITGTATDSNLSSLTVSVDGGAAQSVPVDSQGGFQFNPGLATDGSADGYHQYVFTATDAAGNVTTTATVLYLATQKPVVNITSPADNQTFNTNPTFQGNATSKVGTGAVDVYVDGVFETTVFFPTNGNFQFTTNFALDGSANGQHTVTFIAKDPALNMSDPVTITFTLQAP
jgi:cyclophilin family peptidyl-prolyl cis-trans isomerase